MSLFDSASLVITPNGVKEDKLYSIKPTDGSGDLTVTRATTATRVNSAGLIEQVPYNLYLRSEEFDNASWAKSNATVTANATNSPIGNLTSDKVIASATTSTHFIVQQPAGAVSGVTATMSIFAKASELSRIQLLNNGGGLGTANFNLSAGTATLVNGVSASIENYGNGWYRCIMSYIPTITGSYNIQIRLADSSGNTTFLGNGTDGLFLWGAQLVTGTSAKEYFPTTDRLDVPRLDYTNSTCPSILVEPQRTNLLTNSDGNLATYTTSSNVTDATNSFNTFANAIQFGDNSLSRLAYKRNFTPTIGTQYTISVFVQMDDNSLPVLGTTNSTGDFGLIINANLATLNPKVEQLGTTNIYRVSVSRIADSTNTQFGVIKYITQSAKGFRITGIQLEVGSNATSYIPTVASTVTRNADVISKTGISSLIGQTEGTIFTEFNFTNVGTEKYILNLKDAASSNVISFRRLTSGEIRFVLTATTSSGTTNQSTAVLPNGNYKIAYKYISGSIKIFINGSLSFTLNPTFTFGTPISIIELGNQNAGNQINDSIKQLQLYKTALTDTECIQLTTL